MKFYCLLWLFFVYSLHIQYLEPLKLVYTNTKRIRITNKKVLIITLVLFMYLKKSWLYLCKKPAESLSAFRPICQLNESGKLSHLWPYQRTPVASGPWSVALSVWIWTRTFHSRWCQMRSISVWSGGWRWRIALISWTHSAPPPAGN